MDVYKTHGAFSWSELTTPDPQAAAGFYGGLFGWTFKGMGPAMGDYQVVNVGDTSVAGIMAPPPGAPPMPPAWGCYVTVTDLDATLARCAQLGGTRARAGRQRRTGAGNASRQRNSKRRAGGQRARQPDTRPPR